MSEMIERMARASYELGMSAGAYDHLDEQGKRMMRRRMRAVLVEMRVPTERMLGAVDALTNVGGPDVPPERAWPTMIDAALK